MGIELGDTPGERAQRQRERDANRARRLKMNTDEAWLAGIVMVISAGIVVALVILSVARGAGT